MKLQTKILLVFFILITIVFAVINFVVTIFYKNVQDFYISQISQLGVKYSLPDYIFKDFFSVLFLWEAFLILSLSYLFYKILDYSIKKEEEQKNFLELIILMISHKFGNFLSVLKTNLEILKIKKEDKVIQRLERTIGYMEEDFKTIINILKNLKQNIDKKEPVNIKEIIEYQINLFKPVDKKIYLRLKDKKIVATRLNIENILFLLIENSIRYSKEKIYIKSCKNAIFIRNDIATTTKGTGIGLNIASYLAEREKIKIKYREKNNRFIIAIVFT